MDGYVYDAEEEPKFLMTGKCNEFMSYQPCDSEGEPTPGTELKEVGSLFISPSPLILIGYYAKLIHFSGEHKCFILFRWLGVEGC